MTHTRFHSRIRMAMGALCAMAMVLATAACSFNPQPEHPTASTSKTPQALSRSSPPSTNGVTCRRDRR